jgi:type II secretory pathway pseudopilin PulG
MTSKKTKGFTIVELLTVMSIIIILMSVLMPGLQRTRRYAKILAQKAQFHEINKGLELYRNDHQENFPDSTATDSNGIGYCGAMKLCEALLGQDGMGFHENSNFQASQPTTYLFDLCYTKEPTDYDDPTDPVKAALAANLRQRTKYLETETVKAYRLNDLYPWDISTTGSAVPFYSPPKGDGKFKVDNGSPSAASVYPNAVISDVFQRTDTRCNPPAKPYQKGGKAKLGLPVLYYKADTSKLVHDAVNPPVPATPNKNIYNVDDNYAINGLGRPWDTSATSNPDQDIYKKPLLFYIAITNLKAPAIPQPHNLDSYILLSAGWDGLYGTDDDVYNFAR